MVERTWRPLQAEVRLAGCRMTGNAYSRPHLLTSHQSVHQLIIAIGDRSIGMGQSEVERHFILALPSFLR
jgi:hypothetical protein